MHSKNSETPILLSYWFNSSKFNHEVFATLNQIQKQFDPEELKIICLNPFNSQEDIAHFKKIHHLDFDMRPDAKQSVMFYQIQTYPCFVLMENNGKILFRQNGYKDDLVDDIEKSMKLRIIHELCIPGRSSDLPQFPAYKNNLSPLFP